MKKGDQILISRSLGTGIIFSAFMNGQIKPYIIDSVLQEMNKIKKHTVKKILKNVFSIIFLYFSVNINKNTH